MCQLLCKSSTRRLLGWIIEKFDVLLARCKSLVLPVTSIYTINKLADLCAGGHRLL